MLYLRTGSNGSCKSLFTLKDVRDLQIASGRPVCIIVGDDKDPERQYVKVKPEIMADFGWSTCQFKDWWDQPDGTIFFGDECHNYLPKRPASSAVPLQVSRLAEHRARGFDWFLTTQHPMNIDEFVRRLIGAPGWHQHLKRVFGGTSVTRVLQWDAVNPQCEKAGSGKSADVTTRQQPKEVFKWYDSASLHTAKVRIPKQLIVMIVALLVVPLCGYFAYQRLLPKAAQAADASKPDTTTLTGGPVAAERRPVTTAEYVASYTPRVPGLMHTAPAYDKLTEPKRVPVPAACVDMASKGCKCFTQDATPYPTPQALCRDLVAHGAFMAFQPEGERSERQQPAQTRTEPVQGQQTAGQGGSGFTFIGNAEQPRPAQAPPAVDTPQRIASVRR